jgi:hypothetical protein
MKILLSRKARILSPLRGLGMGSISFPGAYATRLIFVSPLRGYLEKVFDRAKFSAGGMEIKMYVPINSYKKSTNMPKLSG